MGRWPRIASPVSMRASCISRRRRCTCTSPACRSSRHARTVRCATTDVVRVVEARLHLAPRLRQRVLPVPGQPRAVRCGSTTIGSTWTSTCAARPSRPPAVGSSWSERSAASSRDRSIDRSRCGSCTSTRGRRGRTAVLLKLHHALADGIGGMLIGSALFDLEADAPLGAPARPSRVDRADAVSRGSGPRRDFDEMTSHPADVLARAARPPDERSRPSIGRPFGAMALVGHGGCPPGSLRRSIEPARRFATADVPFDGLRTIKRALGGTINDVVLTAVAIGLHELLARAATPRRAGRLRVMVPVSVRSSAEAGDVGNRVAPAFVEIPVGRMSPRSRLAKVRRATEELKSSSMAVSADAIIGLGAFAPPALHAMAARARLARPMVQPRRLEHPGAPDAPLPGGRATRRELSRDAARRARGAVDRLHVAGWDDGIRADGGLGHR